jgi:pimeloyl-ACP methyl ester carboxylesterase
MFGFQSQLIFPTHAVAKAGPLPPGAERLSLKLKSGETLSGVHIPPDNLRERGNTLILMFAGNAWNAQDAAVYLHELFAKADVIAYHYRGYAPSTGSASAEALLADAPLVFDAAVDRVRPRQKVAVGLSIGSGVAAHLATKRELDGIILVTPFESLKAVAQDMFPWLPIGSFFEHEIDAAAALQAADVPTAIIAAEHDELVQPARTAALRRRAKTLVFDRTIGRAGHNDIYSRSDFHAAMREALAAILR